MTFTSTNPYTGEFLSTWTAHTPAETNVVLAETSGAQQDWSRTTMRERSVALRGEALFLIRDEGLVPCSDWDIATRYGVYNQVGYRDGYLDALNATTDRRSVA